MDNTASDGEPIELNNTVKGMTESPRILTHTLQRISLVNWYLFRMEDLEIRGRSVLITGRNGAGKSTILDAIQSILAGADEVKLSYNAISNDGAAVTRSLKSYCLGEVGESDGGDDAVATRPRDISNTYISLSWRDRNDKPYSFGCAFYARKNSKRVEKHFFVIKGYDLSSSDYMQDQHSVMPWKDFERRLGTFDGQALICTSATEFRNRCSELMSAPGSSQAISSDTLFRTIKKGLQFRQQKNVTEFIRDYILPEREIDVVSIENDYKQYVNICKEIENARDRLESYQRVIKNLEKHQEKAQKAVNYDWVAAELSVSEVELKVENLTDAIEKDKTLKGDIVKEQDKIEIAMPLFKEAKEVALLKYNDSDMSIRIEKLNTKIKSRNDEITSRRQSVEELRRTTINIEAMDVRLVDDSNLRLALESRVNKLREVTDFGSKSLQGQWPRNVDNLQLTIAAIQSMSSVTNQLRQRYKVLDGKYSEAAKELGELTEICKKLESGKASLQRSTEKMIRLLAEKGIVATPICDLAEITDSSWQWGIERFLGVWNREALLIMDGGGVVAGPEIFEEALSIYRSEKNDDKTLRAVKLLNPEKITPPRKLIETNTAPDLIESESIEALHYLQGLLFDVQLVETEAELRRSRRAITRDGMVAGNGAISGGNRIDFVLLGKGARKEQAQQLLNRISELVTEEQGLRDLKAATNKLSDTLSKAIELTSNQGESIISDYQLEKELVEANSQDQENLKAISAKSEYTDLKLALEKTEKDLTELNNRSKKLAGDMGRIIEKIGNGESEIYKNEAVLEGLINKRRLHEGNPLYNAQLAATLLEKLEESSSLEQGNLANIAQGKAGRSRIQSEEAKKEASNQMVLLCERHDIEGKEILINLSPAEQLETCQKNARVIEESEIVIYEQDARDCQDSMLNHFRSGVVSKLQDSFAQLTTTMRELNNALKGLCFNNFEFKFTSQKVETPALSLVYDYTMTVNHLDSDGGLFDGGQTHEGIKVIEEAITNNQLAEIADYRNFFSYDINATDSRSKVTRTYSELLGTGSEGEKQSPFYVALAASFVNAYKLNHYGSHGMAGGAALALFDEAMSKMDGVNTSAALRFFNSLGLQILMAAPPETAVKVGTNIPTTMRVTRSGGVVYIDETEMTEAAKKLMESDDPRIHPEVAEPFEAAVRKEFGVID